MNFKKAVWLFATVSVFASCGSENHGTTSQSDDAQGAHLSQEQVCDCIADMDAALEEIIAEADDSKLTLREWLGKMEATAVDCMKESKDPAQGNRAFVEMQEKCPGFAKYQSKVDAFRTKLKDFKERETPESNVKDMREIAPGGAQELLDKLKNERN